jgi:predicted oxidoreductase
MSLVTEAMEDGVHSVRRAIKYGRYAAEDVIGDALHKMKRKPLQAIGVALAAGVLLGGYLSWAEFRRR